MLGVCAFAFVLLLCALLCAVLGAALGAVFFAVCLAFALGAALLLCFASVLCLSVLCFFWV